MFYVVYVGVSIVRISPCMDCLIASLRELVAPDQGAPTDAAIRRLLREQDPSVGTGFLALARWWRPIIAAFGKDPGTYTVRCHAPHGVEQHGTGARVLLL